MKISFTCAAERQRLRIDCATSTIRFTRETNSSRCMTGSGILANVLKDEAISFKVSTCASNEDTAFSVFSAVLVSRLHRTLKLLEGKLHWRKWVLDFMCYLLCNFTPGTLTLCLLQFRLAFTQLIKHLIIFSDHQTDFIVRLPLQWLIDFCKRSPL